MLADGYEVCSYSSLWPFSLIIWDLKTFINRRKENRYLNGNLKIKKPQEEEKPVKFLNKNRFVVELRL
jgi:hypothetical protein